MGFVVAAAVLVAVAHTALATTHANNFAVIVGASKFWFNYRHASNSLAMYHSLKRLGVPDSNIVLMLAEDAACNPRNPLPARVYSDDKLGSNLYEDGVQVDYRASEVTVENFLRVLTGKHESWVPARQRLMTDDKSNVLVYLTGHGGDGFLKFQDQQEVTATDIANAFSQMHQQRRYNEVLFMVDTCQAASLFQDIQAPSIAAVASSRTGENSYAYGFASQVGVMLVDRFTHFALEFLEGLQPDSDATLADLVGHLATRPVLSTVTTRTDLIGRPLNNISLMDFFAQSKRDARLDTPPYPNQQTPNTANHAKHAAPTPHPQPTPWPRPHAASAVGLVWEGQWEEGWRRGGLVLVGGVVLLVALDLLLC